MVGMWGNNKTHKALVFQPFTSLEYQVLTKSRGGTQTKKLKREKTKKINGHKKKTLRFKSFVEHKDEEEDEMQKKEAWCDFFSQNK